MSHKLLLVVLKTKSQNKNYNVKKEIADVNLKKKSAQTNGGS